MVNTSNNAIESCDGRLISTFLLGFTMSTRGSPLSSKLVSEQRKKAQLTIKENPNAGFERISCVPWSKVAILGMVIPPFNRNPYNGYINPYGLGLIFPIPYYMEIMGVDRPDRTCVFSHAGFVTPNLSKI